MEFGEKTMREALRRLLVSSIKEIREQGHEATGRGIRSLELKVFGGARTLVGQIIGNDYLIYLDTGTRPHWVPIGPLKRWANRVGTGNRKERESMAYRVQRSIAKIGTPSPGSFRFSKNGRRLNWTKFALEAVDTDIEKLFEESDEVEAEIENILRREGVLAA